MLLASLKYTRSLEINPEPIYACSAPERLDYFEGITKSVFCKIYEIENISVLGNSFSQISPINSRFMWIYDTLVSKRDNNNVIVYYIAFSDDRS